MLQIHAPAGRLGTDAFHSHIRSSLVQGPSRAAAPAISAPSNLQQLPHLLQHSLPSTSSSVAVGAKAPRAGSSSSQRKSRGFARSSNKLAKKEQKGEQKLAQVSGFADDD